MPELVTIPNVTLIETGEWEASTGTVTFTSDHLYAAVAATESDVAIKLPRMRFGHTKAGVTPEESAGGFEEQPCVGKFKNLRVEGDGSKLVGDLVGVPAWLAEILPVAYPNRSVEAYFGVETATGKKHGMVVTSVALLGENLPAVQTLEDLEILFSEEGSEEWIAALTAQSMVAASSPSQGGDRLPQRVAASIDMGDVRSAFYEQIATEESGRYWWWMHQVYIDPSIVIAEDDGGDYWMIPYDAASAEMGDPVQVFIQWVEQDSGKVAASASLSDLPAMFSHAADQVFASAESSRPAGRQQEFIVKNKKEAKAAMPIDTLALTKRLGLPEDATEEQINAALAAEPEAEVPEDEDTPEVENEETEEVEETEAVAASAGDSVTLDKAAYEQLQRNAKAGADARKQQVSEHRSSVIKAAIKDRKIPPAREAHYLSMHEGDPKGTEELLNKLEKNAVPGEEIGTSENNEDGGTRAQGTGLIPELREKQEA